MITSVTDALALLGVVTAENNQFKREQMKDRLPAKMQPLAKNVPPECEWLFGNDLSKRINHISNQHSKKLAFFPEGLCSREEIAKTSDQQI